MTERTARLSIEPLTVDHADGLFSALDDERVGRYIGGPDVTTLTELIERIEHLRGGAPADSGQTWLNWAVRTTDEPGPVIGRLEATVHDGIAEIAYVFGPAWWGHGYATEGTRWMVGELLARPDVDGLWATVDPGNTASSAVLERLGFERVDRPGRPLLSHDDGDLVYRRGRGPTVHLLCGRNGGGKTTLARELARQLPAVRLSRDEWMIRMHGLAHDDPEYARLLPACTELLWSIALNVLSTGVDVVLDWNHWSRIRRSESARRARSAGYRVVLHHVDVPLDRAVEQALRRSDDASHNLSAEGIRRFEQFYEPPGDDEGIAIEHHVSR